MFIRVPFVFTRVHSCSLVFTRVHSCSFVFTHVHSCSLVFTRVHSCSFVFTRVHSCSLVFTRVHSCSTRVHSCSLVFTRVPLVFTRAPLVFTRVHSCSFVFTRVHSCSLVFICVHSCSFVFRSVWCFRYDPSILRSFGKTSLLRLSLSSSFIAFDNLLRSFHTSTICEGNFFLLANLITFLSPRVLRCFTLRCLSKTSHIDLSISPYKLCCICQRHVSKFSDTCDRRKFKSSVKYEEYFEPAFGLRPNEKRDGMITLDKVYRAMTADTEPRRWIPNMTVEYHEPRRWSIMSHNGEYRAATVGYHEPRRWGTMSDDSGYRATTVGIMSHDGGYRATTVGYHEP